MDVVISHFHICREQNKLWHVNRVFHMQLFQKRHLLKSAQVVPLNLSSVIFYNSVGSKTVEVLFCYIQSVMFSLWFNHELNIHFKACSCRRPSSCVALFIVFLLCILIRACGPLWINFTCWDSAHLISCFLSDNQKSLIGAALSLTFCSRWSIDVENENFQMPCQFDSQSGWVLQLAAMPLIVITDLHLNYCLFTVKLHWGTCVEEFLCLEPPGAGVLFQWALLFC